MPSKLLTTEKNKRPGRRFFNHILQFFLTQRRKDAKIKNFTTEPTEITEKDKRPERRFFNHILRSFLTQRRKDAKKGERYFSLILPLRLCVFAFNFLFGLCVLCGLFFIPAFLPLKRFFNYILRSFLTQRRRDAKKGERYFSLILPLRLCVFAFNFLFGLCVLCGLFFVPAFLSLNRFFNYILRFFLTQRRRDAETQRKIEKNETQNILTSLNSRLPFKLLTTEKNKRPERLFFNHIHLFFLTKNHFSLPSLRLCVSAPLRFIQLQNAFKRTFSLPYLFGLCVLCGLFFVPAFLSADPWGKDADLARCKPPQTSCEESQSGPGVAFSELFIQFHQEVISPADGPRSHFYPSSSQYTLDAVRCYGFFKGWMMGCDRLMRENDDPWVYKKCLNPSGQITKYDPIK